VKLLTIWESKLVDLDVGALILIEFVDVLWDDLNVFIFPELIFVLQVDVRVLLLSLIVNSGPRRLSLFILRFLSNYTKAYISLLTNHNCLLEPELCICNLNKGKHEGCFAVV
jgi:hypothetical protein